MSGRIHKPWGGRSDGSSWGGGTTTTTGEDSTGGVTDTSGLGNQATVALLTGAPELKRGDRDGEVPVLQRQLDGLGLDVGGMDGIFGGGTEAAVLRYQAARHLSGDGAVDTSDASLINQDVGRATSIYALEDAAVAGAVHDELAQRATPEGIDAQALASAALAALDAVRPQLRGPATTAIPGILQQCAEVGVRAPDQVAYILATTEHESDFGQTHYDRSESLVEDRNGFKKRADGSLSARVHTSGRTVTAESTEALERAYWDSAYGGRLGNAAGTSDGQDFRGRGYVQITGRANYRAISKRLNDEGFSYTHDGQTWGGPGNTPIDLEAHPEHINQVKAVAARILVAGSIDGAFTNRALGDYISEDKADFKSARKVINDDVGTNGEDIAELARNYAAALHRADIWRKVFA